MCFPTYIPEVTALAAAREGKYNIFQLSKGNKKTIWPTLLHFKQGQTIPYVRQCELLNKLFQWPWEWLWDGLFLRKSETFLY